MRTVKYIGPDAAVLAGTYIQSGETRTVSAGQLLAALAHHPAAHFEIVSGALPQNEVEQEPDPQSDPNAGQPTPDDQPPTPNIAEEPVIAGAPAPPAAEEPVSAGAPAPTAPVRRPLPPQRPNQNDRHQRRR